MCVTTNKNKTQSTNTSQTCTRTQAQTLYFVGAFLPAGYMVCLCVFSVGFLLFGSLFSCFYSCLRSFVVCCPFCFPLPCILSVLSFSVYGVCSQ